MIQRISSIRNYAFVYYGTSSCVFHVDLAENFKMSLSQQYTSKTRRELLGTKHDTSNLYKGTAGGDFIKYRCSPDIWKETKAQG